MNFQLFICLAGLLVLSSQFAFTQAKPVNDYDETEDYPTESDPYLDDYELETSDEAYNCPGEERQIAFSYLCDEFPDCNDGSDEDPEVCAAYKPPTNLETSASAIVSPPVVKPAVTVEEEYYYDEYEDCPEDMFQCPSLLDLCIPLRSICDGIGDCPDAEDELYCGENATEIVDENTNSKDSSAEIKKSEPTEIATHEVITFTTSAMASSTIENNLENDLNSVEPTMTSKNELHSTVTPEHNSRVPTTSPSQTTTTSSATKTTTLSVCHPVDEFECRTRPGDCVPRNLLCDGYEDCEDGSDEKNCGCASNEYQCISGLCISATYRCDGFNDCGDLSDEIIGCPFVPEFDETRPNSETPPTTRDVPTPPPPFPTNALPTKQSISGDQTASSLRECQRNICQNGGTCLVRNSKEYICNCPKGFSGSSCQINDKCLLGKECPNSGNTLHAQISMRTLLFSSLLIIILQYLLS